MVKATAEEFFQAVADHWAVTISELDGKALEEADRINPEHAYFLQHFSQVARLSDRNHDFFKGDEPTFEEIKQGRDAGVL